MSDTKDVMNKKLGEIKKLIHGFCEEYLNSGLEGYCFKLFQKLARKRDINILRSSSEQWAASIIYLIARLNFLFDQTNEYHITTDDICDYFDTKKSTTGNKATQIEKLCNLSMGAEGYCSAEISDMFIFYETESGFIIPKLMLKKQITEVQRADENDELETKESIHEKRQREIQEHLSSLGKKTKRRNEDENQLGLFDK